MFPALTNSHILLTLILSGPWNQDTANKSMISSLKRLDYPFKEWF